MKWTPSHLLDLEYFLRMDTDQDADALTHRDRAIFLNLPKNSRITPEPDTTANRRNILSAWLDHRKAQTQRRGTLPVFPGQVIAEALRTLAVYFSIIGLGAGASLTLALLSYTGKAPINVFTYLFVLVIPQMLLVAGLLLFMGLKRTKHPRIRFSPLLLLFSKTITHLAKRFGRRFLQILNPSERQAFLATLGSVSSCNQTYGKLFVWPLLSLTQCFGIMFNLGALGATLVRVLGSDLAFGWQSTLQISTRAAHGFVSAIALPWSWLIPQDMAHPDLEQIAGSKMVLKEGIYSLATPDLVSWWPFLCFALICYGLIPRIILYILTRCATAREVRAHPFSSPDIDRLLFRMTTPLVETTPRDFTLLPATHIPETMPQQPPVKSIPEKPGRETLAILIPEEIAGQCPQDQLYQEIHRSTGNKPSIHFTLDPYDQQAVLDQLHILTWHEDRARIAILQEAWQPPIRELLDFVTTLTTFFEHPATVTIALIGKPAPGNILTPPDKLNAKVWKDQIARLANPALEVIKLGRSHA